MHYSNKKKVVEWLQEETLQNIFQEIEDAHSSIECSECDTLQNVKVIDWGRSGSLWWCVDCLKRIGSEGLPETLHAGNLRIRFQVFERDGFKCVYCGRNPREDNTKIEIEHVHPKSKGGSDRLDNLVTACRECNAGKGDLILNERIKRVINPDWR